MNQSQYVYRPTREVVTSHVRKYATHYGVVALFALALALVPRIGGGGGADEPGLALAPLGTPTEAVGGSTPQAVSPSGSTTAAANPLHALARPSSAIAAKLDGPAPADASNDDPAVPTPTPAPVPSPPRAPDQPGLGVPALPNVPVPAAPDEAQPLLGAVAPIANTGCTAAGLAGVVLAIAGPAAPPEVPVADVIPYVAYAYAACATFPPPSAEPLVCDIDEQMRAAGYPQDASGLMKTPNVIGMGVEVLYGIEAAVESYTGQRIGMVDTIAAQLGCHPDAG